MKVGSYRANKAYDNRSLHQATRRLRPPGSELSGEAGREALEVLVSEPKGSPDLTLQRRQKPVRGAILRAATSATSIGLPGSLSMSRVTATPKTLGRSRLMR
jgi:hypothetical protein